MVTPATIKSLFTEFASLNDSYIQQYITAAALTTSAAMFKAGEDHATSYLTAHLLTIAKRANGSITGSITQQKVGDLSRSYSAPTGFVINALEGTAYGQEYLRFRKTCLSSPLII